MTAPPPHSSADANGGRMNPNAPDFSPSPSMVSSGGPAVVQYGDVSSNGAQNNRPRDLIVHETLKHLVKEMEDLKVAYAGVGDEIRQLRSENVSLRQTVANLSVAPDVGGNLTGYAASDTCSSDFAPTYCQETRALSMMVEQTRLIVSQIVEKLNDDLVAETTKREKLQTECDSMKSYVDGVKGQLQTIKVESDAFHGSGNILDRINAGTRALAVINNVRGMKEDLDKSVKAKRAIDNCPTRDALYQRYAALSKDLENTELLAGGEIEDQIWELRDRVLVRLAIFDLYGKALREAKSAEADLL